MRSSQQENWYPTGGRDSINMLDSVHRQSPRPPVRIWFGDRPFSSLAQSFYGCLVDDEDYRRVKNVTDAEIKVAPFCAHDLRRRHLRRANYTVLEQFMDVGPAVPCVLNADGVEVHRRELSLGNELWLLAESGYNSRRVSRVLYSPVTAHKNDRLPLVGGALPIISKGRPDVGWVGRVDGVPQMGWRYHLGISQGISRIPLSIQGMNLLIASHAVHERSYIANYLGYALRAKIARKLGRVLPESSILAVTVRNQMTRQQYIEHLVSRPYALVVRGYENFAYRMYEAMSLGRIPVVIDTDVVMPLESIVPWDDICVRIPLCELHLTGQLIQRFHDRWSPSEFRDLQYELRRWFEYFHPRRFFIDMLRRLVECHSGTNPESGSAV